MSQINRTDKPKRTVRRTINAASAAEAVGEITRGIEIYGLSKGQFSLIELVERPCSHRTRRCHHFHVDRRRSRPCSHPGIPHRRPSHLGPLARRLLVSEPPTRLPGPAP